MSFENDTSETLALETKDVASTSNEKQVENKEVFSFTREDLEKLIDERASMRANQAITHRLKKEKESVAPKPEVSEIQSLKQQLDSLIAEKRNAELDSQLRHTLQSHGITGNKEQTLAIAAMRGEKRFGVTEDGEHTFSHQGETYLLKDGVSQWLSENGSTFQPKAVIGAGTKAPKSIQEIKQYSAFDRLLSNVK